MVEVRVVRASDIARCPYNILLPSHYENDGTCRCRPAGTCAVCKQPTQREFEPGIMETEDVA